MVPVAGRYRSGLKAAARPGTGETFRLLHFAAPSKFLQMESAAAIEFLPGVATPAVSRDFVVLSIHDVALCNRPVVEAMINELQQHGVRTCSLLIVPNYHHQGRAMQDRNFVSWLRHLEAAGHEIVIHGYFHDRSRRENESIKDKFLTRV